MLRVSAFNEHTKWPNQKYLFGKLPFMYNMRKDLVLLHEPFIFSDVPKIINYFLSSSGKS